MNEYLGACVPPETQKAETGPCPVPRWARTSQRKPTHLTAARLPDRNHRERGRAHPPPPPLRSLRGYERAILERHGPPKQPTSLSLATATPPPSRCHEPTVPHRSGALPLDCSPRSGVSEARGPWNHGKRQPAVSQPAREECYPESSAERTGSWPKVMGKPKLSEKKRWRDGEGEPERSASPCSRWRTEEDARPKMVHYRPPERAGERETSVALRERLERRTRPRPRSPPRWLTREEAPESRRERYFNILPACAFLFVSAPRSGPTRAFAPTRVPHPMAAPSVDWEAVLFLLFLLTPDCPPCHTSFEVRETLASCPPLPLATPCHPSHC